MTKGIRFSLEPGRHRFRIARHLDEAAGQPDPGAGDLVDIAELTGDVLRPLDGREAGLDVTEEHEGATERDESPGFDLRGACRTSNC